jgi:hypothetical protein
MGNVHLALIAFLSGALSCASARDSGGLPSELEGNPEPASASPDALSAERARLDALGEAAFRAAEHEEKTLLGPLPFPVYTGDGSKADVLQHVNTRVKDWYTARRDALEKVDGSYAKVMEIKPVPPPRWTVEAAARVGVLWSGFVDDFRSTAPPREWAGDAELSRAWKEALDDASLPFLTAHAKPAFASCASVAARYPNAVSQTTGQACRDWLATRFPAGTP